VILSHHLPRTKRTANHDKCHWLTLGCVHREDPPAEARSVQTTWLYTLGSIVFFFVILQVNVVWTSLLAFDTARAADDVPASLLGLALLALAILSSAVQIRFCWFLRVGLGGGMPGRTWVTLLWGSSGLVWLVGLAVPGMGLHAALPLWMTVTLTACLVGARARWALIAAGGVVTLAHPVVASELFTQPLAFDEGLGAPLAIFYTALLPVMVVLSLWWWAIVVELDRHRRASADLAVARERLRFASDLHDIQGHHLQVIALKSELAERLLDSDPDAARENIHEARVIARQALDETRSLVYGYRDVALANELENAREVLSASGARCELDTGALPENADVQRALALVVREATTNILRHSSATRAWIRLRDAPDGTELVVGNDRADAAGSADGTGLAGLRERVAAVGGRLDVDYPEPGAFELRVWVPAAEVVK
jgi:two-component system sensor histidine kinase DesK